jgi:hypothetical protein
MVALGWSLWRAARENPAAPDGTAHLSTAGAL